MADQCEDLREIAKELFDTSSFSLQFYLNNEFKDLKNCTVDPKMSLLEYLRDNGLTGTKYGCGEGGCGACTVVIAEYDRAQGMVRYRSANACLLPLCAVHDKQVITIEGIGNYDNPHPIQERLAKGHASQCGFCTPGIVMAFYGFLKLNTEPCIADIEDSVDGNLCRCTGYRPIIESFRTFAKDEPTSTRSCRMADFSELKPYNPQSDMPFPNELVNSKQKSLMIVHEDHIWLQPINTVELLKVKQKFPGSVLIGGNTEIGIQTNIKLIHYEVYVNVSKISELQSVAIKVVSDKEARLELGANITLTDLIAGLKGLKPSCQPYQQSAIDALLTNLKWFASTQIRNFATLAGNIVNASPISDLNPILMACDAKLLVASVDCSREIPMRDFIIGYRTVDLQPNEILLKVCIPLPVSKLEIVRAYKQSRRKDDDIAIVTAGFRVKLNDDFTVSELDLSYGGLAARTILLKDVREKSRGLNWCQDDCLDAIQNAILDEVTMPYSVVGGMPTYRRTLAVSFFTKFWHQVSKQLNLLVQHEDVSANVDEIERNISSSILDFGTMKQDPYIGTTQPHASGLKHTTGTAVYVDDIPKQANELYAAPVMSTKPHALIKSVDASKAIALKGVHAFIDHKDIKKNSYGTLAQDDEFFATTEVKFVGQIIGLVIAETKSLAHKAAGFVRVEYEPLGFLITIDDAIQANSFFDFTKTIQKGEFDENTFRTDNTDEFVFEGTVRIGGQEHFYLETQGCLVIPKNEDNEIEVYSATQGPSEIQREIAAALGIARNKVVCKVKRIGGGFGGKETRATGIAVTAAVAANKLKRPIRFTLNRDEDMMISGTRHPFFGHYRLKITRDGLFKAYDLDLIANAGYSYDLSHAVVCNSLFAADNVYNFPNMRVKGRLAKTNIASNTAFRGFGAPQGLMATELMITEVGEQLGIDPLEIREKNMYKELDVTHYSVSIMDWYLPEMWNEIIESSGYRQKRVEIEEFNSKNRFKKRGLAITPVKFICVFKLKSSNQAGALVHIYTDGSVLVSHAGVEMGQGLHTKMLQIAANTLHVSPDCIHISDTATDKVPNTIATAASVSSDLNGMAVYNACKELYDRLEPYRLIEPNGNLASWASAAFVDRISLSATGYYRTPDITYDWNTNTGQLGEYFTNGVAVSSVELDVLTGNHVILRSDIMMDIGNSINFAVDIGQIEGAFIQGVGWCTNEELLMSSTTGALLTTGPGYYKIPTFHTIPVEFNVKILKDKTYKRLSTIKTSKGVGEPPLFLGASVFFALRDAVRYARESNGICGPLLGFHSPCTPEILRLACGDAILEKSLVKHENGKGAPWGVRP